MNEFKSVRNLFKAGKKNFVCQYTNYSARIEYEDRGKIKFIDFFHKCNPVVFRVANKIKADVNSDRAKLEKVIVNVKPSILRYYAFNLRDKPKRLWYFDINSAYAQSLQNLKLITDKTFGYITAQKKLHRLAAVGQLATRYTIETYEQGQLTNIDYRVNDEAHRKLFFQLVDETVSCMNAIRFELPKEKFFFYWVDGIFLEGLNTKEFDLVCQIFDSFGYEFKFDPFIEVIKLNVSPRFTFHYKNEKGDLKEFELGSKIIRPEWHNSTISKDKSI